jgi:tetratricopeptide (TPR) repeat protein
LYFDEFAAVYLKKGYADAVPAYAYQAQLGRYKTVDDSQIDSILHRRYAAESLKARLTGRYSPISELGLSTFCYYDDRFKEAVQICLNGLMRSSEEWPELYYNLGHNFYEMKDFERAQYCYRRFLETQKDRLAFERVALIQSGKAGRVRPD